MVQKRGSAPKKSFLSSTSVHSHFRSLNRQLNNQSIVETYISSQREQPLSYAMLKTEQSYRLNTEQPEQEEPMRPVRREFVVSKKQKPRVSNVMA